MTLFETAVAVFAMGLVIALLNGVGHPVRDWAEGDLRGAYYYFRETIIMMAPFAVGLFVCVAMARLKKR